jgi:hypothetical protein
MYPRSAYTNKQSINTSTKCKPIIQIRAGVGPRVLDAEPRPWIQLEFLIVWGNSLATVSRGVKCLWPCAARGSVREGQVSCYVYKEEFNRNKYIRIRRLNGWSDGQVKCQQRV